MNEKKFPSIYIYIFIVKLEVTMVSKNSIFSEIKKLCTVNLFYFNKILLIKEFFVLIYD